MAYNPLFPDQIVKAGDMSSNITSPAVYIQNQDNVGFEMVWTGSPTGIFSFQLSFDYKQDSQGNITNPGNWVDLPVVPIITASGSPDQAIVDINQISVPYIRAKYLRTSGTGSLAIYVGGKAV